MTLSALSPYRGGAIDQVAPLAQTLKAIYLKYGVGYRISRFQTGPNEGDWFVIVTYADATAYERRRRFSARHGIAAGLRRDCKVRQRDQPRDGDRSRVLKQSPATSWMPNGGRRLVLEYSAVTSGAALFWNKFRRRAYAVLRSQTSTS
jgi:hypothetical protein